MAVTTKVKRSDLVYPELSYKILGVLFDVWTDVGFGHRESFYQKATAKALRDAGLAFSEQLPVKVKYKEEKIGIYYLDFLIEKQLILELKVRNYFSKKDIIQLLSYLKAANLKLGIIAHFTSTGVKFKRVVNII